MTTITTTGDNKAEVKVEKTFGKMKMFGLIALGVFWGLLIGLLNMPGFLGLVGLVAAMLIPAWKGLFRVLENRGAVQEKIGAYGSTWDYFFFAVATTLAWFIALFSARYFAGPETALKFGKNLTEEDLDRARACADGLFTIEPRCEEIVFPLAQALNYPWALYLHIVGAILGLMIGPIQLYKPYRQNHLKLHRYLGRLYVACIITGGIGGASLALTTTAGVYGMVGFLSLALIWVASVFVAVYHARNGDIESHRNWMLRNYACTFAAVTLRVELGFLLNVCEVDMTVAYAIVAWSSWTLNLIVMELYLASKTKQSSAVIP